MRYAVASLVLFAACHSDIAQSGGGGDDASSSDAQEASDGSFADAPGTGEAATFTVKSSDIVLQPGDEVTKCFYFHTPNTAPVNVKKWSSHMTSGSHHMIMFFGSASQPADGTINTDCGLGGAISLSNIPVWIYGTQIEDQVLSLPSDDGTGKPLAQVVPANQPAYFQMHYLNATDAPLTVHVELSAYGLAAGTAFTQTSAYVTYDADITIAAHETNHVESKICATPNSQKFWQLSTHSHKQSIHTDILDGTNVVFESNDWQHPGTKEWDATPFYTFTNNSMKFECTYNNTGDNANSIIHDGPSAQTDEMCMATGYTFPSTAVQICYCSSLGCYLF
jgi:hypothetical protein